MQLDIFEHSHDVMLRNDVIAALERRDAAAARSACGRLAKEAPTDATLAALRLLVEALYEVADDAFVDHRALAQARHAVEALELPVRTVFGKEAGASWMIPLWEQLACRSGGLRFASDATEDHAAPLWLRAGQWNAAAQAVGTIPSWRRMPAPLGWMTEARLHLLGLQATWPLIAELGWLSPTRLNDLLRRSPDPILLGLARKFGVEFEGVAEMDDAAWFAAWVLTDRPDAVEHLSACEHSRHTEPEQAFRVLVELIGLEHQGRQREIVERRKLLLGLHRSLYSAYMKTR